MYYLNILIEFISKVRKAALLCILDNQCNFLRNMTAGFSCIFHLICCNITYHITSRKLHSTVLGN